MEIRAAKIEGVGDGVVRVRALAIDGASDVLETLTEWAVSEPKNYSKIVHSMKVGAMTRKGMQHKERFFKKCSDYVYEFVAYSLNARVMFFYLEDTIILCTTPFWKSNSVKQDTAIQQCEDLRNFCNKNRTHIIIE